MQLDYRGLQVKTWWTEVSPVSLGPASFRLDGFGRTSKGVPQALLGVKHDQSSGMAVQSWSVWAIAEGQRSAEIQLEDYGLISFATRPKDRSNCQLLASQWRPGDQGGLFAVAQWHEMRKGQWLPSRDRPVITRRYLYRFEKQRMNSQNANRPLRWYAHPDTHPRH